MTDVTLASRSAASTLVGDEIIYIEQGGTTKKVTPAQIATYLRTMGIVVPAVTAGANVASCSANSCNYIRQGTMVMYSGSIVITPTNPLTTTTVTVALPVASTFAAGTDASGPVTGKAAGSPSYENGQMNATSGASTLSMSFYPASGGVAYTMRFCIIYPILP